jgi:hypothetical protein
MHIRKLFIDGWHQGAAKATMNLECDEADYPIGIEIHGNYIAVLILGLSGEGANCCVFLVDWKEGTILLVSERRQ